MREEDGEKVEWMTDGEILYQVRLMRFDWRFVTVSLTLLR